MQKLLIVVGSLFAIFLANAANATTAEDIDSIKARYEAKFASLRVEGEAIKDDAPNDTEVTLNIDCEMELVEIKLDLPQVAMRHQEWKFDIPEFWMETKTIAKFDIPETRMATTDCGFGIRCDLPQVRMVTHEFKMDIPQTKLVTQTWKLDIPEFWFDTTSIKLDIPKCKATDATIKSMRKDADGIKVRGEQLATAMKKEINDVLAKELSAKRAEIVTKFDEAANVIRGQLTANQGRNGFDPAPFNAALSSIEENKRLALEKIDKQISLLVA